MNLMTYMYHKYKARDEKNNTNYEKDIDFGVGIDDTTMISYLIDYLLGEDWMVTDPISHNQINEIALYEILNRYSPKYRKEYKEWRKLIEKRNELNSQFQERFKINIPVRQDKN